MEIIECCEVVCCNHLKEYPNDGAEIIILKPNTNGKNKWRDGIHFNRFGDYGFFETEMAEHYVKECSFNELPDETQASAKRLLKNWFLKIMRSLWLDQSTIPCGYSPHGRTFQPHGFPNIALSGQCISTGEPNMVMDWKFAARRLAHDLTRVAHVSAAVIFAAGWFSETQEAALVAAGTWIVIRACGFVLDAWAGPAP